MNLSLHRVDNLIAMAAQGKKVEVKACLHKLPVTLKVHPEAEQAEEQEAVLYTARFHYTVDGAKGTLDKHYLMATHTESVEVAQSNRSIANARLKDDYRRLKKAGLEIPEHYFES